MKIGIILHPYGEKKPAGLARATFELIRALIAADHDNEYVVFLKGKPEILPEFSGCNWRLEICEKKFFWLGLCFKKFRDLDLFIFNTPVFPLFFRPKKSVLIVYDFAYKKFKTESLKEFLKKLLLFRYHIFSIRKSDKIIAISEATKKDVVEYAGIPARKVDVVLLGYNKIGDLPEDMMEIPQKFFLTVGVLKERKNVLRVVRAFRRFFGRHPDFKLLVAGKGTGKYSQKIKLFVKKENLENEVVFLDHVSDNQLCFLYKKAQALIYPSLCEGFGLPVLEAMDCGLPVITSSISSLPEVAGDAAVLVDPFNEELIERAMDDLASDGQLAEKLREKGKNQIQNFSWEKTGVEILQIIKKYGCK